MLSRKHYISIASIIKDNTSQTEDNNTLIIDRDSLINDLSVVFAKDNSLFSRDKFVDACNDNL